MSQLSISPSPHIHSGDSIQKNMFWVLVALVPTFIFSLYNFGIGALIVTATSILACVLFEYLIQRYMLKVKSTITDGSAILTGVLLAFNLPTNLPIWIIIIGALIAIGVGKMSYGGLGNNLFNPALVGRVFMLISFPVQMTLWPTPMVNRTAYLDAVTGATPLSIIKEGFKNGETLESLSAKIPDFADMFIGFSGGSAGETAAFAIILGLVILLIKRVITWHIPVSIIGSAFLFTWFLNLLGVQTVDPSMQIVSGGLMLGAVFMATDYVTSPMSNKGMLVYGVAIGILTVLIRTFGAYPEGISFAILILNGFTPLINKYIAPKRFGEVVKSKK